MSQMTKLPKILKDQSLNVFDQSIVGTKQKPGYNLAKGINYLNPIGIDDSKKTKVTKKGLNNILFLR